MLFRRLCEYEQIAAKKKKEDEYLELRRKSQTDTSADMYETTSRYSSHKGAEQPRQLVTLIKRPPSQLQLWRDRSLMWVCHITGTPRCSTANVHNRHSFGVTTVVAPKGSVITTNGVFPASPM